jgi:hypothetical protein
MKSIYAAKLDTFFLISLASLLTGFWFAKIAIPFIFIILLLLFFLKRKIYFISNVFVLEFFLILLFIVIYLLFWDDPSIPVNASYFKDKQLYMLSELIVISTSVYWILGFIDKPQRLLQLLSLFTVGMLLKSLSIVLYTLFFAPYLLAFRQLLDPFSMAISNSPAISIMAVFAGIIGVNNLFESKKRFYKVIFNLILILGSILVMFLLQARSSIIIFVSSVFLLLFFRLSLRNYLKSIVLFTIISFVFFEVNSYLIESNENYAYTYEHTIERFENEKLESRRYEQWASAFQIIEEHPFGGGSTNKGIERTYWFHNLWLDVGRTSGILPMIFILIYQSIIVFSLISRLIVSPSDEIKFLLIFYLSLLMALFVEVALEGNIVLFVFHIFLGSLILRYLRLTKNINHIKVI